VSTVYKVNAVHTGVWDQLFDFVGNVPLTDARLQVITNVERFSLEQHFYRFWVGGVEVVIYAVSCGAFSSQSIPR
jgi:hypothetical protein